MANKLFLVCTSLALCFLITNASIYRTVVEFDEDDVSNRRPKCQKEFQQAQHLRACQQYMRQQSTSWQRRGGGPSLDDEFDFENNIENRKGQMQSPLPQECCNELRKEEPVCVCRNLKQAAEAVSLQGGQQQSGHEQHEIFKTAKWLPYSCNIPRIPYCPIRIPSPYNY